MNMLNEPFPAHQISKLPILDNTDRLAMLRQPFPAHQISKLPKPYKKDSAKGNCNICGGYHGLPAAHLDYVGHAALTDRLLDVDPCWTWEPLSLDATGLPFVDRDDGMWIKLTVCGVTRLGYGDAQGKAGGNATKERIGDALRNAAMRFGAALDLWHKGDLHLIEDEANDGRGSVSDVTPPDKPIPEAPRPELQPYSHNDFQTNLPAWKKAIETGKATPNRIIAMVSSKYILTDEQKTQINGIKKVDGGMSEEEKKAAFIRERAETQREPGEDE